MMSDFRDLMGLDDEMGRGAWVAIGIIVAFMVGMALMAGGGW